MYLLNDILNDVLSLSILWWGIPDISYNSCYKLKYSLCTQNINNDQEKSLKYDSYFEMSALWTVQLQFRWGK